MQVVSYFYSLLENLLEHYGFATLQILLSLTRSWFRIRNSTVQDNITLEKCADAKHTKLGYNNWDLAELKVSWDDSVTCNLYQEELLLETSYHSGIKSPFATKYDI
jgi:hypothetical protein